MTFLELLEYTFFGILVVSEATVVIGLWALYYRGKTPDLWRVVFGFVAILLTFHLGWCVRG